MAEPSKEERDFAMFTHLSPLAGYVIPFGNVIGPLVMWSLKRDQSPFLERVGREALNFQITVAMALVACIVLGFVTLLVGFIVLIPIMILIGIADLVMMILAAVEASAGREYRFPVCLRLVQGPAAPAER